MVTNEDDEGEAAALGYDAIAVILNPANEGDYLHSCTRILRAKEAIIDPFISPTDA